MDFQLSEEQELLTKTGREFAQTEIGPHAREWDEKQEFPRESSGTIGEGTSEVQRTVIARQLLDLRPVVR